MNKSEILKKWVASIIAIAAMTALFGDFGLIATLALIYLVVI